MPIATATRIGFQVKGRVYFYDSEDRCKDALMLAKLSRLDNPIKIIEIVDEIKFRLAIETATWLCDIGFRSSNPFLDQHNLALDAFKDFKNNINVPKDISSRRNVSEDALISALIIRRAL
jgi:hypothetical protein